MTVFDRKWDNSVVGKLLKTTHNTTTNTQNNYCALVFVLFYIYMYVDDIYSYETVVNPGDGLSYIVFRIDLYKKRIKYTQNCKCSVCFKLY